MFEWKKSANVGLSSGIAAGMRGSVYMYLYYYIIIYEIKSYQYIKNASQNLINRLVK